MNTTVHKRSVVIGGHKTSVSLEEAFWRGLQEVAQGRGMAVARLVEGIDKTRGSHNLSSAIRLFLLQHYRTQAQQLTATRDAA